MTLYHIIFYIAIGLLLLFPLLYVLSSVRLYFAAKAGKVSKPYPVVRLSTKQKPRKIRYEGKTVDTSSMLCLYVHGNSMQDYKINDGDYIFIERFNTDNDKHHITGFPVVVFSIADPKWQSKYKVRKFVGYVHDNDDWNEIFSKFENRIKSDKQTFVDECSRKVNKLKKVSIEGDLVLSETYDEPTKQHLYSLHPVKSLFGKVRYAI